MSSIQIGAYTIYDIAGPQKNYAITVSSQKSISNASSSQRGAYKPVRKQHSVEKFTDPNFSLGLRQRDLDFDSKPLKERRIFDIYQNEFEIFEGAQLKDQLLDRQKDYPSFVSEFIMIDRDYARTLFLTKNINKSGYYEYFVRRNGEYFVEEIDDVIPVSSDLLHPIWGLSINEPWKLLLMKAWIKQKRGIEGVLKAEPFEFIEAFGFPGYRVFSFKKESSFLNKSSISAVAKQNKAQKFPFHLNQFNVFGKTKSHVKVKEYGLIPNKLGYKITSLKKQQSIIVSSVKSEVLFKVQSLIPNQWVGKYSVINKNKVMELDQPINVEREFICTFDQISELFSKFYAVRKYRPVFKKGESSISSNSTKFIQHSICQKNPKDFKTGQFYTIKVETQGHLNINVQVSESPVKIAQGKKGQGAKKRYPPIKLLLGLQKQDNKIKDSLNQYSYYDGDYVKAYHKLNSRFIVADPGTYLLYVKVDTSQFKTDSYAVNINGNAQVSKFQLQHTFDQKKKSSALRSILYTYATNNLLKLYPTKDDKDKIIYIGNSFDQIGFGVIVLLIKGKSKNLFGAKVHSEVLAKSNIILSKQAHENVDKFQNVGNPVIIIMQKTDRKSLIDQQFPPKESFEFYEVYEK